MASPESFVILNPMGVSRRAVAGSAQGNPAKQGNRLDHGEGTGNAFTSDVEGAAVRD